MANKKYEIKVYGGKQLPLFLTKLKSAGTVITMLSVIDEAAYFRTNQTGLRKIRKYRRRYGLKVRIRTSEKDPGFATIFHSHLYLISFLIPLICSFFLWSIKVDSEMPEVADRIETKLEEMSIVPFRPLLFLPKEDEIRRALMKNDPALSWVRFQRAGTSLAVIPMLSPQLNTNVKEKGAPSHLVAETGGVLTRFALTSGERVGYLYRTVKKGDILATGVLEQGDKRVVVGAEGAVFADYWVEYSFTVPNPVQYKIQGEETVEFQFQLPATKDIRFPQLLKEFVTIDRQVAELDAQLKIEEGMEKTVIIPLIKQKVIAERGLDATIKEEKVLHVTYYDDKVSGTILFLINDNIAVKRPITEESEAYWMKN